MADISFKAGVAAFASGAARGANPFDADTEQWLNWRDGWEQAKAFARHVAEGTAEFCHDPATDASPQATR